MIVSIDTFSDNFSVSILGEDKKVLALVSYLKPKPFSELLIPQIDQMMDIIKIQKDDISKVVVNKGPGSNTGLRVGIATAKVISYTLKVPIYGYVSLDAMAYAYRHSCKKLVPAINIGKGRVVYKIFERGKNIHDMAVESIDKFLEKFGNNEDFFVVAKNIEKNFPNFEPLILPLSIYGAIYSLEKDTREDVMFLEPIYHD